MGLNNVGEKGKRHMRVARRLMGGQKSSNVRIDLHRMKMGEGVEGSILTTRACPEAHSPKRQVEMMDVCPTTPAKKPKKTNKNPPRKNAGKGKSSLAPPPYNQPLLTDVWKSGNGKSEKH